MNASRAKAIVAACVARGVSMEEREPDDIRFAAHEAYHGFDLDLEDWSSDSIHEKILSEPRWVAAATEIEARAAEWLVCERLGIPYDLEKWTLASFMEGIKGVGLRLPREMPELIRMKRKDPRVKKIVGKIVALGKAR